MTTITNQSITLSLGILKEQVWLDPEAFFPAQLSEVVSDLEEAEMIFTVLQIHLLGVKITQRPAESQRMRLQLRRLAAARLHAGSDRCTATVTGVAVMPVLIHFCVTVTGLEDQISQVVPSVVVCCSDETLKRQRESHVRFSTFKWHSVFCSTWLITKDGEINCCLDSGMQLSADKI